MILQAYAQNFTGGPWLTQPVIGFPHTCIQRWIQLVSQFKYLAFYCTLRLNPGGITKNAHSMPRLIMFLGELLAASPFGAALCCCDRRMTHLLWLTIDNGQNGGYAKGLVLCAAEVWGSLSCSFITSRRFQRHRAHLCWGLSQWIRQS